ncbi:hypothetical protein ACFYXH_28380 [Streptomyces sp. NPDC002730]
MTGPSTAASPPSASGFSWFTIGGLVLVALVAQAMPRRVAGYADTG